MMKSKKHIILILLLSLIIIYLIFYIFVISLNSPKNIITNYKPNNQPGNIVKPEVTPPKSIVNTTIKNSDKSASSPVNNSSGITSGRYVSGICHIEHIPYSTENLDDSSMSVGSTRTVDGIDGLKNVCTDNSDGTNNSKIELDPSSKKIYSGTKPLPPVEPTISREECVRGYLQMRDLDQNNAQYRYKAMVYCSSIGY